MNDKHNKMQQKQFKSLSRLMDDLVADMVQLKVMILEMSVKRRFGLTASLPCYKYLNHPSNICTAGHGCSVD